jgi:hypothetical protein
MTSGQVARKGVDVHAAIHCATTTTASAGLPKANARAPRHSSALTDLLPDAVRRSTSIASFAGADRGKPPASRSTHRHRSRNRIVSRNRRDGCDERGRRVGGARQTGTAVPASAGASVGIAPLVELQTYLELPPGDYELRAAVMNADTQAASSVFTHVTVPSFDDAHLSLSDVVLGTRENAGSLPEGAPAMPIVPTTTRAFGTSQAAWAFVRVYREAGDNAPLP